ncbi:hypothetical protein M885DRAFT_622655, partial [Pelagophyceae sp. CCMP2097]
VSLTIVLSLRARPRVRRHGQRAVERRRRLAGLVLGVRLRRRRRGAWGRARALFTRARHRCTNDRRPRRRRDAAGFLDAAGGGRTRPRERGPRARARQRRRRAARYRGDAGRADGRGGAAAVPRGHDGARSAGLRRGEVRQHGPHLLAPPRLRHGQPRLLPVTNDF